MVKCPYCGRELTKHERYCYHCEHDLSKVVDEAARHTLPEPRTYNFKKDAEGYSKLARGIARRLKHKKQKEIVVSAYCVKCKKKVNIKTPKEYAMKNGKAAVRGTCPICSRGVFRILGNKR